MLELVYDDGGSTQRLPLRDGLSIGRASNNDLVLRDFSVSRNHAKIASADDGSFKVVDLGSTNGVKVNETYVTEARLAAGDRLTIGSFEVVIEDPSASAEQGMSSATYLRPLAEFNMEYGLDDKAPSKEPAKDSTDTSRRERMFEILALVAKTLIEVEDLDPVLNKVMDVVFEHLMVDRGFILLIDANDQAKLELYRARSASDGSVPEVPISRTILEMVTRKKVAMLTHDAQADQRFSAGQSIRIHQIRSAMCAPLWHRDNIVGVIYVDSPLHVGSFSAGDLDLLTALANYAAVAIERARLNEKLRHQEQMRSRLERYHSPAVIESVLSGEMADTEVTLRETSVFFADIVGFTSRCEGLPPQDVATFLNEFFSRACDAIFEYGGTLDKFIGDAVMAFFGAPLPQPDHAERSVRAAIMFLRSLDVWNREREEAGLDRIDVRIAINSGQVVVGDIGSATRVDYTVLGNTVNVASRLESYAAKPNQIVIGEGTQNAVKDLVPTEHLGDFQFKGLSNKLAVYRVESEKVPAKI